MQNKYKLTTLIFTLILLFCAASVEAQTKDKSQASLDINTLKGKFVVLKIPSKLVGFERVSNWSGDISYGAIIEKSQKSGLLVSGINDWKTSGWTLMRQLTFEKISREDNFTLIELKDPLFNIKLRFDKSIEDLNGAFSEVAFVGLLSEFEESDYYKKEIIGKVLPKVFTGKLDSISTVRKMRLLNQLNYIDSAISEEKYKGDTYLSVDVGGDTEIYNTIRLDQTQRLSHSLNQRVLSYLKRIARIIKFHSEVDGIKITILVPYKNFVTETYLQPNYDRLEIYAPMDVIRQFADDELTNEELVEEAILLVNGNRIRLSELKSL